MHLQRIRDVGGDLMGGVESGGAGRQPLPLHQELQHHPPAVDLIVLRVPEAGQIGARIGASMDVEVAVVGTLARACRHRTHRT